MQQETLHATKRVTSGSRPSKRLRRDGRVPGVVYGSTIEPQPIHVSERDLYAVLHTEAGLNAIIELDVEGSTVLTVAREVQRHPARGEIEHLDFIEVRLDTEIDAEVGIDYLGIPIGVRDEGGMVETIENSIRISALPNAIPSSIEVDIEHLGMGDTLKVSDLPVIDGVTYAADEDAPLLLVTAPAALLVEDIADLEAGEDIGDAEGASDEGADEDEG
ncbi:MAG TPA: 50S ribosomal protein L25 [Acidimicrobiia bacterium]|nr:50S ribosomal protein L25 [Acidimicrobiia bacterium]